MTDQTPSTSRRLPTRALERCIMAAGAILLGVVAMVDLFLMLNGG